jgi:ubiquinone/menaquinone biosynthesis C-methylase UbiE
MPGEANRRWYERSATVDTYARQSHLNPGEHAFIDRFAEELAGWSMLDIGIGAGRTTIRLAPLVGTYKGVDYAEAMVTAAQDRFGHQPELASAISVADARRLDAFGDATFDAVLFVAQGLDSLDHRDRLTALREMARVCRPGGYVYLSSHNLASVDRALSLRERLSELRRDRPIWKLPLGVANHMPERLYEKVANPSVGALRRRDHAFLVESWPSPGVTRLYYAQPAEVLRQLVTTGLTPITVVGDEGDDLGLGPRLASSRDLWPHYLARRGG